MPQGALPKVGRQGIPLRQLAQVRLFLGQHLGREAVGSSVQSPVGHAVAPLQGLPVQIGIIGEAYAGPQVAPDVLYPALHLALGLGPIRLAQLEIKAQPHGEVQHPPVPLGTALLVPAQGYHLGIVIQAAPGYAAQVVEGVDVTLDEAGRVRSPDELHVDGLGPAEHHHEGPDSPLPALFVHLTEAPPVPAHQAPS